MFSLTLLYTYSPCVVVTGGVFLVVDRNAIGDSSSVDRDAAAVARLGFCGWRHKYCFIIF